MTRQKYSLEFKDQAVHRVIDECRSIVEVAREIDVHEGTLSKWVRDYRDRHPGEEEPLTVSERAQLKALQVENRELRMKSEFLGKAAAFFAQEYR